MTACNIPAGAALPEGEIEPGEDPVAQVAGAALFLVLYVMAVLTALTHAAQITGVSFRVYAIAGVCVGTAAGFVAWWFEIAPRLRLAGSRKAALVTLAGIGVAGALVAILCYRPDADDAYYVPNVVYYLAHPAEPMGFVVHSLDSGGAPFVSYHWATSMPFEYMQGIAAYVFRIPFLTQYHKVGLAVFGAMIPLVWFYAISRFSRSVRASICGAIFVSLCLLLMGEKHRTFGNLAFNRVFHGKAVLLSVGIPFFAAVSVDYLRRPSVRRWMYLFITSVAMVGATASTTVLVGLLAVALAVAYLFSYASSARSARRVLVSYVGSLAYAGVYGISILLLSSGELGASSPANQYSPKEFLPHFLFVFDAPVSAGLAVAGTGLALVFLRGRDRRFVVFWIVSVIVLYLNPVVSPFLIAHVSSPNIYWRVFYLYPFPLVLGLAAAGAAGRLGVGETVRGTVLGLGVVAGCLLAHMPQGSPSIFRRGGTRLKLLSHNVRVKALEQAREVARLAPAGTMLATTRMSQTVPLVSGRHPQMRLRTAMIQTLTVARGEYKEARRRIRASAFLSGRAPWGKEQFLWIAHHRGQIRSILAAEEVAGEHDLYAVLAAEGFSGRARAGDLVIFYREAAAGADAVE